MKRFGQTILFIIVAYLIAIAIDFVVEKIKRWNAHRLAMKALDEVFSEESLNAIRERNMMINRDFIEQYKKRSQ